MPKLKKRKALNLIEVVVVIVILVLLLALLLPPVQRTRDAARRNGCINNQKQLALAALNYESAHKRFPVASDYHGKSGPTPTCFEGGNILQQQPGAANATEVDTLGSGGFSWIVSLLPMIEEQALYDAIDSGTVAFSTGAFNPTARCTESRGTHVSSAMISSLLCPSFAGDEISGFEYGDGMVAATGTYCAMTGTHQDSSNTVAMNGAFPCATAANNGLGRRIDEFHDGTSKTILFTESKEENYNAWYDGATTWVTGLPILGQAVQVQDSDGDRIWDTPKDSVPSLGYGPDPTNPSTTNLIYNVMMQGKGGPSGREWGPSSEHSGIIVHAYADGHVDAMKIGTDWGVYCATIIVAGSDKRSSSEDR